MLSNYFKTSWRTITRHKLFSLINVLGLAIGISACLIIYLVTSFELSYDRFHPDGDRIYRVVAEMTFDGKKYPIPSVPNPAPMVMRKEFSGIGAIATFHNYYAKVRIPGDHPLAGNGHALAAGADPSLYFSMPKMGEQPSPVIISEPEYFSIFHYDWIAGNAASSLGEPYKVVLTESQAHKYFGSGPVDKMIGRQVIYNDSLRVQVSGIVADWKGNTDLAFSDFISFSTVLHSFLRDEVDITQWGNFDGRSQAFVKLGQNVRPGQFVAQTPAFIKKYITLHGDAKVTIGLQPLSDLHFNAAYPDFYSRKADLPTLYVLMGIAVFILLLAAVNFINLFTARAMQRTKEIGIRKVLGSNRMRLVLQFLGETFIVTCFAVLLSFFVAWQVLSGMHSFIPAGAGEGLFHPSTALFLLSILLFTSLLAGFYPALALSSRLPLHILKGSDREKGDRKGWMRSTLTVFQLTVSLILIIGMLLVSRQIDFVQNQYLGFNKDGIVDVHTEGWGDQAGRQERLFADKLRKLGGVDGVSVNNSTPAKEAHSSTSISYAGSAGMPAQFEIGDENYVPLFQLKLVAGRNLMHSDTIRELLINETCAKTLGFKRPEDAIGKILKIGIDDKNVPVVGVIADFHAQSLHERIQSTFITSSMGRAPWVSVKLHTGDGTADHLGAMIAAIQKTWAEVYPDQEFNYSFFDETIAKFYQKEQKTATIMKISAAIAILISCMGLFGLALFTAERRTKEIGIRKVLGASVANITLMLSRDFVLLILIALLIASPFAWYGMNRWLADYAYRVDIGWWIFALAGIGTLLIGLCTVGSQAIRAAVANPVDSLRSE